MAKQSCSGCGWVIITSGWVQNLLDSIKAAAAQAAVFISQTCNSWNPGQLQECVTQDKSGRQGGIRSVAGPFQLKAMIRDF